MFKIGDLVLATQGQPVGTSFIVESINKDGDYTLYNLEKETQSLHKALEKARETLCGNHTKICFSENYCAACVANGIIDDVLGKALGKERGE